jgi:hypothetical protein
VPKPVVITDYQALALALQAAGKEMFWAACGAPALWMRKGVFAVGV